MHYIYCRVSNFEQFAHGFSIDAQVKLCLDYAAANGLTLGIATNCDLPGVFIDGGKSAYTKRLPERPGGARMLQALRPGDGVISTSIHRLFRRLADTSLHMETWAASGIAMHFVDYGLRTDTPNGRLLLHILAAVAQWKSEITSARVREARMIAQDRPKGPVAKEPVKPLAERYQPSKDLRAVIQEMDRHMLADAFRFTGRVRGYVRVSTKEQTVEQQQRCIEKGLSTHADMQGHPIDWYVDEGVSAFTTPMSKRSEGGRLMKDLQRGDIVVVWRPDRMFRSIKDMANTVEQIHAAGAYLFILEGGMRTDTVFGRTMVSMLSLVAEIESQEISRSTKQGLMTAVLKSDRALAQRLPQMLRPCVDRATQRQFSFNQFFTAADRYNMHVQMYLQGEAGHYETIRDSVRSVCNRWLEKKGFPPLTGYKGDFIQVYQARVRLMQREEFSERRYRLLQILEQYPPDSDVMYPIVIDSLTNVTRNQNKFLKAMKAIPGRLVNKKELVMLAASCADPAMAVKMVNGLTGAV